MGFFYQICKILGINPQNKKKEELQEEILEVLHKLKDEQHEELPLIRYEPMADTPMSKAIADALNRKLDAYHATAKKEGEK